MFYSNSFDNPCIPIKILQDLIHFYLVVSVAVIVFDCRLDLRTGPVRLRSKRRRADPLRTSRHRIQDGRHPTNNQQRRPQLVAGEEGRVRRHRRTHTFPRASGVEDRLPGHRKFQKRSRLPKLCLLQTYALPMFPISLCFTKCTVANEKGRQRHSTYLGYFSSYHDHMVI